METTGIGQPCGSHDACAHEDALERQDGPKSGVDSRATMMMIRTDVGPGA